MSTMLSEPLVFIDNMLHSCFSEQLLQRVTMT